MRAVGYTPDEMKQIICDIDFKQFKDDAPWGTKTYHLLKNNGVYAGDKFLEVMREFMKAKGVKYFGDLKVSLNEPSPLFVYTADVSYGRLVRLPDDISHYGLEPNLVEIAWAIRASMSIPFFFRPVKIHPPGNGPTLFVDGGLLSNFPVDTFDVFDREPRWPTFGVMLWEEENDKKRKIDGPIEYLSAIFNTVLSAHDRKLIRSGDYVNRTIRVPVGDIKTTDFDITLARKEWLVNNGFEAATNFLQQWDWNNYVNWAVKDRNGRAKDKVYREKRS